MQASGRLADLGVMDNPSHPVSVIHYCTMSNAERQRRFRARNPGYHRRYYVPTDVWRARLAAQEAASRSAAATGHAVTAPAAVDAALSGAPAS